MIKLFIMNLYPLLCTFLPCILYQVLVFRNKELGNRKSVITHFVWTYIFILYIHLALKVAGIGSVWDIGYYETIIRVEEIHLIPFKYGISMTHILNIIMFMPLGFLLPLVWKRYRNIFKTIIVGAIFSLLIEFSQLFNLRTTDIDDLIMNILGSFIGYFIWLFLLRNIKNIKHETYVLSKNESIIYIILSTVGMFFLYNWKFIFELLYV